MRFPKSNVQHWKSARHRKYFGQLFLATPPWLDDHQKKEYHNVFATARAMRRAGKKVHVDHIVPLCHPYVCGLNVPWNLNIIDETTNMSKGNRWWPDCPHENVCWVGSYEPQQLTLNL